MTCGIDHSIPTTTVGDRYYDIVLFIILTDAPLLFDLIPPIAFVHLQHWYCSYLSLYIVTLTILWRIISTGIYYSTIAHILFDTLLPDYRYVYLVTVTTWPIYLTGIDYLVPFDAVDALTLLPLYSDDAFYLLTGLPLLQWWPRCWPTGGLSALFRYWWWMAWPILDDRHYSGHPDGSVDVTLFIDGDDVWFIVVHDLWHCSEYWCRWWWCIIGIPLSIVFWLLFILMICWNCWEENPDHLNVLFWRQLMAKQCPFLMKVMAAGQLANGCVA